ncbi:MAG TPA: hypothetical protein PLC89_20665 [Haliscomenobacter sp.]|uniref:hypothetical protein n=1 Tax=Haliscomenobacter sp. TaxID=2717303 RepID=UPI002BA49325|nr:hypothetical protein [Haliscomenobacter sp.]HOY19738.1 hypothetical protein [Haliscomenobacter sp.]HPH17276.1 hypothetical protein [Haliscomenobacter sp.]
MKKLIYLFLVYAGCAHFANAQNIYIDKPVLAGKLTCFPDIANPNNYYFLPNKLRLGVGADGSPQFSFLMFVRNTRPEDGATTAREGEGGGVVHAVVELYISDEEKKDAERELKRLVKNDQAVLLGPVIYKSGTMSLVSSIASKEGGYSKVVLGLGPAPVLAGNKAAVSILLNKEGSKILWETFKTPTPDMSFSFVMDIGGYRSPIAAWIDVNFDKLYESKTIEAGLKYRSSTGGGGGTNGSKSSSGGTPIMLDAEVKLMFEEMRQTGAIKVGGPQGDEKFEEIIKICYTKMLDMLFDSANPNQQPQPDFNSMLSSANQINNSTNKKDTTANKGGIGISVAYKFKQVRRTGNFRMDLNRSMSEQLKVRFDENLGKINCPSCFRQINLDDPMFRQRGLMVSVDGMDADQFKKYVNFVGVSMKKTHGNGDITSDEVRIGVPEMEKTGNLFQLQYGWKDEKDAQRDKWLQYQYKTSWSFFGNQVIESEWVNTDNFTINVSPPIRPVAVDIEASPELLKQQEVRSVNVKFYYNPGNGERMEQINVRADVANSNTASRVEFVLPDGKYDYEYEITWRLSGNREVKSGRLKGSSSLLYVDELPK